MAKTYMLDTNVVISLSKYHKRKSLEDLTVGDNLDFYKAAAIEKLYNQIKDEEIYAVVPPQVYDEVYQGAKRFGPDTLNYLIQSKIFVITDIPADKQKIIEDLSEHYFNYVTKYKETAFDRHEEKYNGKNDAVIMATASVLGLNIITFDKHFTKKYGSIKETNADFKLKYLQMKNLTDSVSKNYDYVKVHKPTFVLKDNIESYTF